MDKRVKISMYRLLLRAFVWITRQIFAFCYTPEAPTEMLLNLIGHFFYHLLILNSEIVTALIARYMLKYFFTPKSNKYYFSRIPEYEKIRAA